MNEQTKLVDYPASVSAREWAGDSYGDYIRESMNDYVRRGIWTEEHARTVTLGELFIGNDGE